MKKRYLITGAHGFIGINLVKKLIDTNADIHIITRPVSNLWRITTFLPYLTNHVLSLSEPEKIKTAIKEIQPEYIFHFASEGNNSAQQNVSQMIQTNIVFSQILFEALNNIPYKVCIITGSSSEYGFKKKAMKEDTLLEPASFYAATKAGMTHIAQVYRTLYNKPIVVARPFSVYGPYEDPSRLIPTVIHRCLHNLDVLLTEGKERRDFIYIDDFIEAITAIADNPVQTESIFNIGIAKQYTTRQIVTKIHRMTRSKSRLLWGSFPNRQWDTAYWRADITRMYRSFGWKPIWDIDHGIGKTIEWMKQNEQFYGKKNKR